MTGSNRSMIFECAKKYAPNVKIEQAYCQPPFDVRFYEHDSDKYKSRIDEIAFYQRNGDYFRVYDASPQFRSTALIWRTMEAFRSVRGDSHNCISIPNVEDEVYLGASLGCSIGAMRHSYFESRPEFHYHSPINTPMTALKRALMWHRIAPPFRICDSGYEISDEVFTDSYDYPPDGGNAWPYISDKLVVQDCYGSMSRNMPLPAVKVSRAQKPFVVCSLNPNTRAVSVYSAPRTIGGSVAKSIPADVTIEGGHAGSAVGIFGKYKNLTIIFDDDMENKKVYAQDLCVDEAVDITDLVSASGRTLTIPGTAIEKTGLQRKEYENELPRTGIDVHVSARKGSGQTGTDSRDIYREGKGEIS